MQLHVACMQLTASDLLDCGNHNYGASNSTKLQHEKLTIFTIPNFV